MHKNEPVRGMVSAVASVLLLSSGCSSCFDVTEGSGTPATEDRAVENFHAVSVDGTAGVKIVVGQPKSVAVTFDDNLIEMVTNEVVGGVLRISTSGSYSSGLGPDIQVAMPRLEALSVSGVADATATDVVGPFVTVNLVGVSSVTMSGKVDRVDVVASEFGEASLKELKAKTAKVSASMNSKVIVTATSSAVARATDNATIRVHGRPETVDKASSEEATIAIEP